MISTNLKFSYFANIIVIIQDKALFLKNALLKFIVKEHNVFNLLPNGPEKCHLSWDKKQGEGGGWRETNKTLWKKCKQLVKLVKNVYQSPLHYFYNIFVSLKLYQNYIQRKVQSTGGRYNKKSSLQEVKRMR